MSDEKKNKAPVSQALGASPKPDHVYTDDDMYDYPKELDGSQLLSRALRILKPICEPYWKSNHEAIRLQKRHRWITRIAVLAGTAAVVLAIFQLPHAIASDTAQESSMVPFWEGVVALLAIGFVIWGTIVAVQKKWLLERHKAERFRFLKYHSLLLLTTNPKEDQDLQRWTRRAEVEASKIVSITESILEERIEEYPTESDSDFEKDRNINITVSTEDFDEILAHYKEKRLGRQVAYFFKKSSMMQGADVATKMLPTVLFFASLLCALTHLGMDFLNKYKVLQLPAAKDRALWLIIGAAVLPVLASAFRTYRAASEYTRNKIRFFGQYVRLKETQDNLPNLPDNGLRLRFLWRTEHLLENEHYQWLFLMNDAEWYG